MKFSRVSNLVAVALVLALAIVACTPKGTATQTPTSQATPKPVTPTQAIQPTKSATPTQATEPTKPAESSSTADVTVKGTDAIFLAGRTDVTIPAPDAEDASFPLIRCGSQLAQETFPVTLTISSEATFTFSATGGVIYVGGDETRTGPDADPAGIGAVDGLGGISGYTGPAGALVGVFLSDANPKDEPAPETLNFSEEGVGSVFDRLAPALGQVFFIGDGRAGQGTGAVQTFVAPPGATRLFLGIADAMVFFGPAGCYDDNTGSFQVQVTSSAPIRLAEASAAQPTPVATEQATTTPTPAVQELATATPTLPGTQATATPAPVTGLASYRVHMIEHEGDSQGAVKDEWKAEVVLSPLAVHYVASSEGQQTMEIIVVGDSVWTKIADMPWRQTKQADMSEWLTKTESTNAVDVQEDVPLEDSIVWLMGQSGLHIAKGSLTPAGEEDVNGVKCIKYTVDSTYSYTATFTVPIKASGHVTYQDQGEIWIADQAPSPSFVVRAQLTEVATTQVGTNSKTETTYIEEEVTDINTPITIQPPE